ncbi:hypothetical protein [Anaerocolumna jejuensis]|uniref:hypothetical protein n=1 Tax=Anaerocolumna jejuensis TaxID=259063 RepID=UPI003F7B3FA6
MLYRIRRDIFIKLIISFLTAFIIVLLPDYQYLVYRSVTPLMNQDIEEKGAYSCIGYPAADDVFQAETVEDLEKNLYFTITINRSDLTPTGYYEILNPSKTGIQYGTGRYSHDTEIHMYLDNDVIAFVESKLGTEYGQFYVLNLKGEKVIIRLDQTLLKGSGTIRLPLGTVNGSYPAGYFEKIREKYGLEKENSDFYIETTGTNWIIDSRMEKLGVIKFISYFIIVIAVYIICTIIFKKYKLFR